MEVTSSLNLSSVTNQTQVNGPTDCEQVDTSGDLFFALAYSLVFVVGLLVNSFTMKVYFCSAQQQVSSITLVYLKNLAASDFLFCLSLPLRIIKYISRSIIVHLFYCNFAAPIFYVNMYTSILFMGYIAADRYLKIVHPVGTNILQTVRAARIISTVTWVFLLAPVITYNTLSFLMNKPLTIVSVSCETLHSAQLSVFYKTIHTWSAAIFLFVLVSLVFFYYSASRSVSLAQQRQSASSSCKKLVKSRRNMLVLVSIFCVCFVPYHLVRLSNMFLQRQCSLSQVLYYLMELTVLLSVLNVCLDPLVYVVFCKAFRAQLSNPLGKKARRCSEGQPRANNN